MISGKEHGEHSKQISDPRQEKKTQHLPQGHCGLCANFPFLSKGKMSVDGLYIHSPQPPNSYTTIAILSIQIRKVLKE